MTVAAQRGGALPAVLILTVALSAASASLSATVRHAALELRMRQNVMCARLAAVSALRHALLSGETGAAIAALGEAEVELSVSTAAGGRTALTVTARCKDAERSITLVPPI